MNTTTAPVPIDQLLAHRAWLGRLARALVRDPQRADDLVQEVWLSAMKKPPRSRRSLRGWLATVLRRKVLDDARATGRRRAREAASPPPTPRKDAETLLAEAEMHKQVTSALLSLDEPYRSTLVLRFVGDNGIGEVARLQGVSIETIRTRLRRGLEQLRRILDVRSGKGRRGWQALLIPIGFPESVGSTTAVTTTTATLAGGLIMGSKLAVIGGAVVVAALATWVTLDLGGSEPDATYDAPTPGDMHAAESMEADLAAAGLEGRGPETAASTPTGTAPSSSSDNPLSTVTDPPAGMRKAEGRIAGRIVGPDGQRVEGATVHAERIYTNGESMPGQPKLAVVVPDEQGWFRIEKLSKGSYALRVQAPGFAAQRYEVPSGHAPVDIALEKSVALVGTLVSEDPSIKLEGVVLLARPEISPMVGPASMAKTDAEGRFRFEGLAPGRYVVTSQRLQGEARPDQTRLIPIRAGPFPGGPNEVEIEVKLGSEITGRCVDEDGQLLSVRVSVEAIGLTHEDQKDYSRRYFTTTSEESTFAFKGLVPGRYALAFDPVVPLDKRGVRGPRTTYLPSVHAGTTEMEVTIPEGVSVQGQLVNGEREPIHGDGWIMVRPSGSPHGGQQSVMMPHDAKGKFHSPALDPATTYTVTVGGFSGFMSQTIEGVRPGAEPLVIEMKWAGQIQGRVVDEKGRPAIGTSVTAYALDGKHTEPGFGGYAYVDHKGHFTIKGIRAGRFRILAGGGSSAYIPAGDWTETTAGAKELVLKVKLGVVLSGKLVDAHDQPIKSPYISITDGRMAWFTSGIDDEGNFRFPGVPAGKLRLSARIDGVFTFVGEITAPGTDVTARIPEK